MRFYCMPFPLSRPNSPSLLLVTVSTLCSDPYLSSCFSPWSQHLFELLSCAIWLLWFMLVLVGYAICLCLFLILLVCAWLGWPIPLTYYILECIAGCLFFPPLPKWWWWQTPWFLFLLLLIYFDDAKRGKIGMTMVVLVWLGLTWFLWNFSLL